MKAQITSRNALSASVNITSLWWCQIWPVLLRSQHFWWVSEFNLPIYSSLIHFIIQGVTLGYWAYLLNLLFHHVMEDWPNGIGIFNLRSGILFGVWGGEWKSQQMAKGKKELFLCPFPLVLRRKRAEGLPERRVGSIAYFIHGAIRNVCPSHKFLIQVNVKFPCPSCHFSAYTCTSTGTMNTSEISGE